MMTYDFKNIHIGKLIQKLTAIKNIETERICAFLKCGEEDIMQMYLQESMDTLVLLRWSKLLEYDFFRIYSQHIILFSPFSKIEEQEKAVLKEAKVPVLKKSIYTREIIDFILELIENGTYTKAQVCDRYNIPKTTLYKWIAKYAVGNEN